MRRPGLKNTRWPAAGAESAPAKKVRPSTTPPIFLSMFFIVISPRHPINALSQFCPPAFAGAQFALNGCLTDLRIRFDRPGPQESRTRAGLPFGDSFAL